MKHRMLLVEDELLERQALRQMIEKQFPQIEIAGEASSGRQALQLAEELHPDIVSMDIRLPGMDGLQTIEAIRQTQPHISFIIMSAFDTFSYAKKAISLGVQQYLLKPYDESELYETLQEVTATREKDRKRRMDHLELRDRQEQVQRLAATEFTASVAEDRLEKPFDEALFDITGESAVSICALVIRSDSIRSVYGLVQQEVFATSRALNGPMSPPFITVLVYATEPGAEPGRTARELWERICRRCEDEQLAVRAGMSSVQADLDSAPSSIKEARRKASSGKRDYAITTSVPAYDDRPAILPEEKLAELFRLGRLKEAETLIADFTKELRVSASTPVPYLMEELLVVCSRSGDPVFAWDREPVPEEPAEAADYLERVLMSWVHERAMQLQELESETVPVLIDYLHRHYMEDVTLESVSSYVHLSPAYVSRRFKEVTGSTFIEHLSAIRIEKAKELLAVSAMPLKEICFAVGYHDPNYFSKAFRRQTGTSPREYRQEKKQQQLVSEPDKD
ncbi:response regulator transcription factor [Alkalicoccus luteus]|uniref:Response regulator n=1 Tax=Alkalicoccus luteus TaxID=1237094 RepID=A0A969PMG5_9BACI|nr:response regulator [Alkalicoccus luteus]NJP36905.1 response regulator [Alkalicoccus luteus]